MPSHWTQEQVDKIEKFSKKNGLTILNDRTPDENGRVPVTADHLETRDGREILLKKMARPRQGNPTMYSLEYETRMGGVEMDGGYDNLDQLLSKVREIS